MSDLVAKCVLRVEVKEATSDTGIFMLSFCFHYLYFSIIIDQRGAESVPNNDTKHKNRGQRKLRDISVETFPSRLETTREDWGLLPKYSRENTPNNDKEQSEEKSEIGFLSGNPFVEVTKGILHLYKEE